MLVSQNNSGSEFECHLFFVRMRVRLVHVVEKACLVLVVGAISTRWGNDCVDDDHHERTLESS